MLEISDKTEKLLIKIFPNKEDRIFYKVFLKRVDYIETSALSGQNVDNSFQNLINKIYRRLGI